MIAALLGFAGVAALLTITPGVDTALVVRTAVVSDRRRAYLTALGIVSGCLVWGVAAAVGASALVQASQLAYDALRLAGAGYLAFLGVRMLVASYRASRGVASGRRGTGGDSVTTVASTGVGPTAPAPAISFADPASTASTTAAASQEPGDRGLIQVWLRGLFVNLLNPKVGVFYLSLIPQFLVPGVPAVWMGLLLALIHNIEGMLWFTLIIEGAQRARVWMSGRALTVWVDRVTGGVLVLFGALVAGEVAAARVGMP